VRDHPETAVVAGNHLHAGEYADRIVERVLPFHNKEEPCDAEPSGAQARDGMTEQEQVVPQLKINPDVIQRRRLAAGVVTGTSGGEVQVQGVQAAAGQAGARHGKPEAELGDVLGFAREWQHPVAVLAPLAFQRVKGVGRRGGGHADGGAAADHRVGSVSGLGVLVVGPAEEWPPRERTPLPPAAVAVVSEHLEGALVLFAACPGRRGVMASSALTEDTEEPASEAQEAGPVTVACPATGRRLTTRAKIPSVRVIGPQWA